MIHTKEQVVRFCESGEKEKVFALNDGETHPCIFRQAGREFGILM
jgi:hypothetical protein